VSLYDLFGFEWTLLQFDEVVSDSGQLLAEIARALGADLKLLTLPRRLRDLYEADLALIRPDQVVAWRGGAAQAGALGRVLTRALGLGVTDRTRLAS
jgi:hypothetical protein